MGIISEFIIHIQHQVPKAVETCLPPIFILKEGEKRIPVWPNPPKVTAKELPVFCPKEHRPAIIERFRVHLHQHPDIPFNDEHGTCLTAEEIYEGAVWDMYQYCFENDLSQVWAYLWNRWYTDVQWRLWARSASPYIPRLKTTMIVESLWKNIKHRDLAQYNRPRLDLVTYLVITNVLPRALRTLAYVHGLRRVGRPQPLAGWQRDMRADWLELSKSDERRNVEAQLRWLNKPMNTKGRTERLAELAEDESRPRGTYVTNIKRWTCSCPSYLISRFLLCKHLVRLVNNALNDGPITSLTFFLQLRRNHYPPYYCIPNIHEATEDPNIAAMSLQAQNDASVIGGTSGGGSDGNCERERSGSKVGVEGSSNMPEESGDGDRVRVLRFRRSKSTHC